MAFEKCTKCGSVHYVTDQCRPKLERSTHKEATVGSDDNSQAYNVAKAAPSASRSSTPKPNRNEYHRVNMRKWRAKRKQLALKPNVDPQSINGESQ